MGQRYSWDNHGHLSQFDLDNLKRATYQYNYQHLRSHKLLWKGAAAATTVYHYDLQGRLLMETSSTGAIQAYYVYDDSGTPLAMVQAANSPYNTTAQDRLLYLHTDHLGTPRMATDTAKRIVWKWESDAFGTTPAQQDPDADGKQTVVNLRFPGQYYDVESGLHQNWHRTYDPSLGRYISSDPIGLAGGLNTFGYVRQKPLNSTDFTGLKTAVILNGTTSGNPFGHTAIATSENGVYSFGNSTALGSNLIEYLQRESPKRDTDVLVINTTLQQESAINSYLSGQRDDLPPWIFGLIPDPTDSCATRTSAALDSAGLIDPYTIGPSFPTDVAAQAELWRQHLGGDIYFIPQGGSVPVALGGF